MVCLDPFHSIIVDTPVSEKRGNIRNIRRPHHNIRNIRRPHQIGCGLFRVQSWCRVKSHFAAFVATLWSLSPVSPEQVTYVILSNTYLNLYHLSVDDGSATSESRGTADFSCLLVEPTPFASKTMPFYYFIISSNLLVTIIDHDGIVRLDPFDSIIVDTPVFGRTPIFRGSLAIFSRKGTMSVDKLVACFVSRLFGESFCCTHGRLMVRQHWRPAEPLFYCLIVEPAPFASKTKPLCRCFEPRNDYRP